MYNNKEFFFALSSKSKYYLYKTYVNNIIKSVIHTMYLIYLNIDKKYDFGAIFNHIIDTK